MEIKPLPVRTLRLRFRLRTALLLMLLCCMVAHVDPFQWRNTIGRPKPIKASPVGEIAEVDVIELNRRPLAPAERARGGASSFDQLLFWSYYPDGKLHIREWRMVRNATMLPKREHGRWVCTLDEVQCIHAPEYRETTSFTTADPEILDRKFIAKQDRVPLWRPTSTTVGKGSLATRPASCRRAHPDRFPTAQRPVRRLIRS